MSWIIGRSLLAEFLLSNPRTLQETNLARHTTMVAYPPINQTNSFLGRTSKKDVSPAPHPSRQSPYPSVRTNVPSARRPGFLEKQNGCPHSPACSDRPANPICSRSGSARSSPPTRTAKVAPAPQPGSARRGPRRDRYGPGERLLRKPQDILLPHISPPEARFKGSFPSSGLSIQVAADRCKYSTQTHHRRSNDAGHG
ncbi:hypothetical protein SAMN04488026_104310 [Aliiruegeria lutimaris]|uniref:Uncharacterized protein n=1 Tax=Aliiruegeria lutimaris TaxID=571298 RepID=A0A1G9CD83_9RHOB|nr:hypothetical protein SAMN04488026_104310 [Aliiruegeria lutimaris]